jgi:hypothetical protein
MSRTVVCVLLLLGILLAACGGEPSEPVLFESPGGGFSVRVAANLKESTQDVDVGANKLTVHAYIGGTDLLRYFISYVDYDDEILAAFSAEEILRRAQAQLISSPDAVILSETGISLGDYPGREVIFDTGEESNPEMSIKARIFLVDHRLYQIMVMVPKGDVSTVANNDFLKSFTLIP